MDAPGSVSHCDEQVAVFITFEGIEAAGKSTLIAALDTELRGRGRNVLVTREPGGTLIGDAVRKIFTNPAANIDPLAEAFLVNASRAQLVADVIAPALRRGTTVLCDRFFDATIAYQGYGRGLDIEMLLELSMTASRRIAPNLTFLIDVPVALSRERLAARGELDRLEREDAEFHERVREGYRELAARFHRMHVLDGARSPEELRAAAVAAIEAVR